MPCVGECVQIGIPAFTDLLCFRFHHDMAPSRDIAFRQWCDIAGVLFETDLPTPESVVDFTVDMTSYTIGGTMITQVDSVAQNSRRTASTIQRTNLDHYLLMVQLAGSFDGETDDGPFSLKEGDIGLLDLSRTVSMRMGVFRQVLLAIPTSILAPMMVAPDMVHGAVLGADAPLGRILRHHIETLFAQAGALTFKQLQGVLRATAMLTAACMAPVVEKHGKAVRSSKATQLPAIRSFIEQQLGNGNLSVETVLENFGLSRPSLYRLFASHGGVLLYIRRRRLERCLHEIAAPRNQDRRIAEIAYDWGFTNETAFSRSFRRTYGMSPREVRELGASHRLTNKVSNSAEAGHLEESIWRLRGN